MDGVGVGTVRPQGEGGCKSAAAAHSGACSSTPTDRADIVVSVDSSSSAQTNFFLVCGTLRFFFFARNGNSIHSVVVF